jgi:Na+/H+ antiporter NhaC
MIAPVSSWAAAVSGVADDLGSGISGIQLFIEAIPYNFYSLLTLVFIIALTLMKFDYGPMRVHEMSAQLNGDLGAQGGSEDEKGNPKGKVIDLLLPVIVLIVTCTIGMLYVGGYFGVDWWGGTDCAGSFIDAFGNTDAFVGLPWGCLIALVFIVIYFLCRRVMTFKEAMECVPKGFVAMVPPIIILTLAVSLKNMTGLLGAADFVHDAMLGAAAGLYSFLPAVIFLVAVALAFASGTSWGTFGILIPIVTYVLENDPKLMIIGISACLAGAVCGDHCSPISDTTIMASAGAQCNHVQHVSTQLPYALTAAGVSLFTYIVAGFVRMWYVCLPLSIALMVFTLLIIRSMQPKKA